MNSVGVSGLKRLMRERRISTAGCLEKHELVDKLEAAPKRQRFELKIGALNVTVIENSLLPDVIVILLHGLGSNRDDMMGVAMSVLPALAARNVRFICVDAPNQMPGTSGYSWYDVQHVLASAQQIFSSGGSFETITSSTPGHLEESSLLLGQLIESVVSAEAKLRPFTHSNVVLGGFSQGATMCLDCSLMQPHESPFKALKLWSGIALRKPQLEQSGIIPALSVFMSHGMQDPMVPVPLGASVKSVVSSKVPEDSTEWHVFPGGHTVPQKALQDLISTISAE